MSSKSIPPQKRLLDCLARVVRSCSTIYKIIGASFWDLDPGKAVEKALLSWNRLARQRGYFTFKGAKNPRVQVVVYPNGNQRETIWKANVIAYPCQFIQLRRN